MLLYPLLLLCCTCCYSQSPCPDLDLAALQAMQKADVSLKESKIQESGFDLHSQFVANGATMRRYNKCWMGNSGGKPMYEQVLLWNTTANHLMYLMIGEPVFQQFKSAIEERHSSAGAQKNNDFYVGRLFMYRYSVQKLDNAEYYAVLINFKS